MSIEIRKYRLNDIPFIIKLLTELQEAENAVEPNRLTGVTAAKSYFEKIQKLLKKKNGKLFVAEQEDSVVGLIILFIETNDIIETPGKHLYISDIVVKKDYRQKEIGMQLVKKAEDYARKHNIPEIRMTSLVKNIAALNLY